jgi:NAD-dependent dihydropyrimidine dehydrogenase PreA subunit
MAIEKVDQERCIGCEQCFQTCYGDVFRMDNAANKSVVTYPQDCARCFWCLALCPANAIVFTPGKTQPPFTSWG